MQAASPNGGESTGVAALELVPLHADTAASSEQSAMMVKLTDESIAAIRKAQRSRLPIKMRMDPQGGQIEIGLGENATRFRFVIQQLPGTPADAVVFDRARGYRATASLQSKVQIQATEKTFAETREKAQKLAEEEKRKATKDVSRQRRDQRPLTVKRATNTVAVGAQRPSPSSSSFPKNISDSSRNNLPKATNNTQNGSAVAASSAGARLVRAELSRKPLRKRVIHLVVLGKFRSADEVVAQLKKDAINEDGVQEAVKARDIVDEVAETGKETGRLQLKQSFYNELDNHFIKHNDIFGVQVDARWPGFNSEEKSMVRKILSGNMGNASNFAPTRKSGMAPPQAPPASHSNNISPEAIPTPPTSSGQQRLVAPSSAGSRKTSPKLCHQGAPAPNNKSSPAPLNSSSSNSGTVSNPLDDLLPSSAGAGVKRKAHVPQPSVVPDKRPRQQSLSPPEDPSSANPATAPPQKSVQRSERPTQNGGDTSTVSSTGSSPLTLPSQPTRDWSKYFGEARSLAEAEKYYNMFIADYPAYMECYKVLASVANEFSGLEKQLNESSKHPREHEKVERTIQTKYAHYQRDTEFLQTRQRHADLRAKLDVLKKRIHAWETNHAKGETARAELDARGSSVSDNLLVM
ncbi:RNA polymerase II elongation factor ELL [Toxocara canis]|uniref:RNA polymerase II elongation factor ELL n=1 Tax=Toxocara canis TaxID=6265 RepID=A0A0B2VZD7_TOXCA|nr:RNA polymerase II elongation factor ELL [Toxocara canis]